MKLDKIQKLLALANDQPDQPEGIAARKLAQKYLKKLGLTEEDLAVKETVLLPTSHRRVWEEALADVVSTIHPVDLVHRKDEEGDRIIAVGAATNVDLVEYGFTSLRHQILLQSGQYQKTIQPHVTIQTQIEVVEIFRNYFVIALSERLLEEEIEDEEIEILEKQEGIISPEEISLEEQDESEEKESFYDNLLDKVTHQADEDFGLGNLNPCICGYNAGLNANLSTAIPEESTSNSWRTKTLVDTRS